MSLLAIFAESERFFTAMQSQMLDGLLGDDAASSQALHAWAAEVDIDTIDNTSYRLIPALYARVGSAPALQSLHRRMKGIYRYYFYRNNRFLTCIEKVLSALISEKIDFILFKGISISLQYHSSAATRSSADCDILVHSQDRERAESILTKCGFAYRYDTDRKRQDRHSYDFVDCAENGFDLHWYALPECCKEGIDDGFWSRSRYITWKGLRLRVLAPEDELLVAGMNGIRETENARADWLYDAWIILRSVPSLDWHQLHKELIRRALPERFLTATGQLYRFIPNFPAAMIEKEFSGEIRTAAMQLVAENRAFALDTATDRKLTVLLAFSSILPRLPKTILGTDWRVYIAKSHDVIRHIRYDTYLDGSISKIYLHQDIQGFLGYIFDVADSEALQSARNIARHTDEIEFKLPPGALLIPEHIRPQEYAATVEISSPSLYFSTQDAAGKTVEVSIANESAWPWHVFTGSKFGISYHLCTEDGELLFWDLPRQHFLVPRMGQVPMLLPAESLKLEVEILPPPAPGRYEARFDIVHEPVIWFDPYGQLFPRLIIEVL